MKNLSSAVFRQLLYEEWEIEKSFDGDITLSRLCESWEIPMFFSSLYILVVFQGRKFMATRSSFALRIPMFIWSSLLAIFSIAGALRTTIVLFALLKDGGFHLAVCDQLIYTGPIGKMWAAAFTYSKFIEFGDTVFIILRKQNLIFLHWYHHLTVTLFSWLMYGGKFAGGSLFMTLNYVVHSFMYSYYAIRAVGIKLPRFVSIIITSLQITQMIIGCLIMAAVVYWSENTLCATSLAHQLSGSIMYGSYLLLFMRFFYKSYLVKRKPGATFNETTNTESYTKPQEQITSSSLRKRNILKS